MLEHGQARQSIPLQDAAGKSGVTEAPTSQSISTGYVLIDEDQVSDTGSRLRDSWKDRGLAEKQRKVAEDALSALRAGRSVPVFDALLDILLCNISQLNRGRVLEIGCASGYYSEVLRTNGIKLTYEGCDYSPALIEQAIRFYPELQFSVEDAVSLNYCSESFDVVISGGCITQIPEYDRAISEAARVSSRWVVFHRTPVVHIGGSKSYTKQAYGVDTFETHFNEQALVRLFRKHGMRVVDVNTHSIGWDAARSDAMAMKTYLCEKITTHV